MLTKSDRKLLLEDFKAVFATKQDLDRLISKEDAQKFVTKEDLSRFATKDDLTIYSTKEDHRKDVSDIMEIMMSTHNSVLSKMDNLREEIIDTRKELKEDIAKVFKIVKGISIIVHNHEYRITALEESKKHN